jgi:hypothetical protein
MDPLATAAEIAAVLQAAEAVPSLQRRPASRRERQEAYFAYQREAYRLMAGVSHLSVLAQVKITPWQRSVIAAIPMVDPFIELLLPEQPSKRAFVRNMQESLGSISSLTNAISPAVGPILASANAGDDQFRDRVIVELGAMRDITAEFLTALAKIRLIGRPGPVEAGEIVLSLIHMLFDRIPTWQSRPRYQRVLLSKKIRSEELREFNNCMTALGHAHAQFMSAVRADKAGRHYLWQVWRRATTQIRSAATLLAEIEQPPESAKVNGSTNRSDTKSIVQGPDSNRPHDSNRT